VTGEPGGDGQGELPADLASTVVRGATYAGLGFALTQVAALGFYIVMARLAGPSTFGAFAAASLVVGVTSLFAESGMQGALIQRKDRLEEAAATAVFATFGAGILLSLLALVTAPLVGLFFHSHQIGLAAASMSGVLFLNAASAVPDALMQRRMSFLRRVIVDPLNMFAYGLAATIMLSYGWGIWALVAASYIAGVVRVSSAWLLNRWRPNLRLASFEMWRELARFGRHVVASEFLREISTIGNIAILGRALGPAALGQFRFGQRIATQIATPVSVASAYVLYPALARIADDEPRLASAARRSLRIVAVVVFPLAFALPAVGQQLVVLLLGNEWRTAGDVLAALFGVTATLPLIQIAAEIFKAKNAPRYLPRLHGIAAVSSLVLMLAALSWGVVGVAGALSLSSLIVAAYALGVVASLLDSSLPRLTQELAPACVAASGAALVTLLVRTQVPDTESTGSLVAELALEGLTMGWVYIVLLWFVGRRMLREALATVPWHRLGLSRLG
jgi:PST family polysaccharide transporter